MNQRVSLNGQIAYVIGIEDENQNETKLSFMQQFPGESSPRYTHLGLSEPKEQKTILGFFEVGPK